MNKKAFTLIELSIVITIIAIVLGSLMNIASSSLEKQKISATKDDLKVIKERILSHVSKHGRLPYPDIDGNGIENDGNDPTGSLGTTLADCTNSAYNCELPYLTLGINGTDNFGMKYTYDVWDELLLTNRNNMCHTIQNYYTGLKGPFVENDNTPTSDQYSVAAVVISKGEDKKLSGKNAYTGTNDRIYEMATNKYHESDNNDLVIELSSYEMLGVLCDLVPDNDSSQGIIVDASLSSSSNLAGGTVNGGTVDFSNGYGTFDTGWVEIDLGDKVLANYTLAVCLRPTTWNPASGNTRLAFVSSDTDLSNADNQKVDFFLREPGDLRLRYNRANENPIDYYYGTVSYGWKFVAFTQERDALNNLTAKAYFDNIAVPVGIGTGDYDNIAQKLYIGRGRNAVSTNSQWKGDISNVKLYDYVLDSSALSDLKSQCP